MGEARDLAQRYYDLFASGDMDAAAKLFVSGCATVTHRGDLVTAQGTVAASGNTIDVRFADYFRVEGARITAHEVFWDQVDMLGQLASGPAK